MDKKVFLTGMAMMAAVHDGLQDVIDDKAKLNVWFRLLSNKLNDGAFLKAAEYIAANDKWKPTPARIIEVAKTTEDFDISAEEAWAIIIQDAKKGKAKNYDNPAMNFALKSIGGWEVMMYADLDKMGIYHANFVKAFNSFRKRQKQAVSNDEAKRFMDKLTEKMALGPSAPELPKLQNNKEEK